MTATGRIAIAGSVAQKARNAGHTWQFLQYLLGFKRLGYEVLLLDSLEHAAGDGGPEERERIAYVESRDARAWPRRRLDGRAARRPPRRDASPASDALRARTPICCST